MKVRFACTPKSPVRAWTRANGKTAIRTAMEHFIFMIKADVRGSAGLAIARGSGGAQSQARLNVRHWQGTR